MNKVKQIAFVAIYVSIIVTFQTLLSTINGLELSTLLFVVAALFLPLTTSFSIVVVYCLIEVILFGFGSWVLLYLVYWSFVVLVTRLLRKILRKHLLLNALVNGIYGFLLGVFFFLETLILYGSSTAISMYITGFPGDIFHLFSNIFISLILFPIISRIMPKIVNIKSKKV
jgi:energy-coupling factor transport system substrate-specific component